jgi:hypothetical protein
VALAFVYPHLMVSPGALVAGHAELATDCFACHAPLRGAASDRCISCHAVADIGLRTSRGAPIVKVAVAPSVPVPAGGAPRKARTTVTTSFHQHLIKQDCITCHSDHAGPRLTQRSRKPFSHDLLKVATRERCESCHIAPGTELHRRFDQACVQCHKTQGWTPAGFDHALLTQADQGRCASCHKAPADALHRQITGNCGSCHTAKAWTPATFDHDRFFALDRDHNAACVTCHVGNNYAGYSCYGCHEHTVANIRAEHEEAGIRDLDNCVRCHRSANEKGEGRGDKGRSEGRGERRQRD